MFRRVGRFSFNETIHKVKKGQISLNLSRQAKFCLKNYCGM